MRAVPVILVVVERVATVGLYERIIAIFLGV